MSAAPGDVDVAILGLRGQGFTGLGELATVTFRIKGEGAYGLGIKATQGRTPGNQDTPVLINSTTAVNVVAPSATAFAAPAPNPFAVSTALSFSLAKAGAVGLEIYSVDGRRVRTLVRGAREAGEYREVWDGRDEAGAQVGVGIYYARLITPQGTFHRKLVRMQ
jgi:hypothetical protein